jgi:hypothetical protein
MRIAMNLFRNYLEKVAGRADARDRPSTRDWMRVPIQSLGRDDRLLATGGNTEQLLPASGAPASTTSPESQQGMSSIGTIEAYSRMLYESSSKMRTLYPMLIFLNPSRSHTCGN